MWRRWPQEKRLHKKLEDADQSVGEGSACEEKTPSIEVCCVCSSEENVKRCGGCKAITYCSVKCQKAHRSYHAPYCAAISDLEKLELDKIYGDKDVRQKQLGVKLRRKMMKLVGEKPMVDCFLGGKSFELLWDTGSMVSLVDRTWVRRHFPEAIIHSVSSFLGSDLHVKAANATTIKFDGVILFSH